jgi:hypothetical protein
MEHSPVVLSRMFNDVPYQGNAWWALGGLGSLLMLSQVLLGAWRKRKAGLPVDARGIIVACVFFVGIFIIALLQVLSHQW